MTTVNYLSITLFKAQNNQVLIIKVNQFWHNFCVSHTLFTNVFFHKN